VRKKKKAPATPNLSEYEITKAANTARNKAMARQLDETLRTKYGPFLPGSEGGVSKPGLKKREKKESVQAALERSTRTDPET
jgi:hypothetical protein